MTLRIAGAALVGALALSACAPRLLDTVQRIADRMHGRIGGR